MTKPTLKRLLVTGGSGFIGQAFIRRMLDEGREVVSLSRSRGTLDPRAGFAAANLADPASLRDALRLLRSEAPFDGLVHLAVSRHHREFPQKALDLFHVNSGSAAELLDFCRETGVRSAIMGSTGTVYSSRTTADDTKAPGDQEDIFRKPASYFAASKLFADAMSELYRGFLPVAVLRFYAPYGPGLEGRMLNDLVNRVRDGRPLSLPAEGSGLAFSALYIDDALEVIVRALDDGWSETVNVASPEVWTIDSVGHLIGQILNRQPLYERTTASHAPRIVPDVTRVQQLLPGRTFVGLEDGLRRMIAAG